ncbi:hypothetical protein BJ165DRAFT_156318 [Panaeolus papilionaceus]|nr:hypothetical protein BJ165DRAFT_156318 [Panaeolus papilionaceus]
MLVAYLVLFTLSLSLSARATCPSGTTPRCCQYVQTTTASTFPQLCGTIGLNPPPPYTEGLIGLGCTPITSSCSSYAVCCSNVSYEFVSLGCSLMTIDI